MEALLAIGLLCFLFRCVDCGVRMEEFSGDAKHFGMESPSAAMS